MCPGPCPPPPPCPLPAHHPFTDHMALKHHSDGACGTEGVRMHTNAELCAFWSGAVRRPRRRAHRRNSTELKPNLPYHGPESVAVPAALLPHLHSRPLSPLLRLCTISYVWVFAASATPPAPERDPSLTSTCGPFVVLLSCTCPVGSLIQWARTCPTLSVIPQAHCRVFVAGFAPLRPSLVACVAGTSGRGCLSIVCHTLSRGVCGGAPPWHLFWLLSLSRCASQRVLRL